MRPFPAAELDERRPGESPAAKLVRGILTNLDYSFEEMGHPFTAEQRAIVADLIKAVR